jgi:hypothetical protein
MAVVTKNGVLYMDKVLGSDPQDLAGAEYAGGRIYSSLDIVTVAVNDEANSRYFVARLPKSAILLPATLYRVTAEVTGTFDVGDVNDIDGLIDGSAGAANTTSMLGNRVATTWVPNVGDWGKPLWQHLSYTSAAAAPSQIDIYLTLLGSTQATNPAVIGFNFVYALPG